MDYREVDNKKDFVKLVQETLTETYELKNKFPDILIYKSIYNQLCDIEEKFIVKKEFLSDNEIFKRYSLGAIAVKNFDDTVEIYARKLEDIFGSLFSYDKMPEE